MIENILPHLHYFWLVAQEKSFTKAARRAFVTQSAVSHQIKQIEEKLETPLFLRGAKGKIALTAEGEQLLTHCEAIFTIARHGIEDLKEKKITGRLAIGAPVEFGSNILVPFLPILLKKYPELKLSVHISDTVEDFRQGKIDIAIRWNAQPQSHLKTEIIMKERYLLVASPTYLAKHKTLKRKMDLKHHQILAYSHNGSSSTWRNWLEQEDLDRAITISSVPGILNGSIHGLGIAVLPSHTAAKAIQEKRLVEVLPTLGSACEPFYFVWPKLLENSAKLAAFRHLFLTYLHKEFKGHAFCKES